MRAYKWTTDKMQAFHDGHQFNFGWNEEDGVKDGSVCRDGGFHITTDPSQLFTAQNAKYPPDGKTMCHCYEVYYLKRDVLGREGCKLRVKSFKILKKIPHLLSQLKVVPTPPANTFYTDSSSTTNAGTGTIFSNWGWTTVA